VLDARGDQTLASKAIERAVQVARELNARSLELRALTSLAGLTTAAGVEALDGLARLYGRLEDGRTTPDLTDALAVLDRRGSAR
jgi:adenylate cyclase